MSKQNAVQTAIKRAPREPFPGNPLFIITKKILAQCPDTFNGYSLLQSFVGSKITQDERSKLDLYLGITAFGFAHRYLEFISISPEEMKNTKWIVAANALNELAKNLATNIYDSLELIEEKTAESLFGKRITLSDKLKVIPNGSEKKLKINKKAEKEIVESVVSRAKKDLQNGDGGSVIRYMMAVYNEAVMMCISKGIQPHLKNLTLGDVTGKNMPQSVVDVMGYDPMGKKGLAIGVRALAYEAMLYEAGVDFDPHRYDLAALGWIGLRKRFVEYGEQFGLYAQNEVKESMIGEGGAGTLLRVFTAIHMHLQMKEPGKKFSVYFPNPAFRMVGDAARDAGLMVNEVATQPSNSFFPDTKELDIYLADHPECRVFILIPIGNPNASFPITEKVADLLKVLKKHNIYLVNDFAYLGTGDKQKNHDLAQVLSSYKKRIDSYSMSKIFGRTGLRCGCAVTTDSDLAAQFSPAAKHIQLGLSYPMEQEAMAIWDYVSQEDRNVLNSYYRTQQKNILQTLKDNDNKRISDGKPPLFNSKKPIFDQAGLYLYIALEGYDAFDVMQETGYVGVPDSAFSNASLAVEGPYMRFALGVERI